MVFVVFGDEAAPETGRFATASAVVIGIADNTQDALGWDSLILPGTLPGLIVGSLDWVKALEHAANSGRLEVGSGSFVVPIVLGIVIVIVGYC